MSPRWRLWTCLCVTLTPLAAQSGTLDLMDGETLYDGGWLVTTGIDYRRADTLRRGSSHAQPGYVGLQEDWRGSFAAHYGLRHDLQVGMLLQYRDRSRTFAPAAAAPTSTPDVGRAGFGDVELFAKWRFYRWDAPHRALNVAAIGGLTLPTGEDDAGSPRLPPQFQVGRGSLDPALGLGVTFEPKRWRFNASALYHASLDTDDDGARPGETFVALLEVGNRFWLEPYPGPFMRFDVGLQYEHESRDRLGAVLPNTGGERLSIGATWAFRPRPSLDFQLHVRTPIWLDVNGTQLAEDFATSFTFGYRF